MAIRPFVSIWNQRTLTCCPLICALAIIAASSLQAETIALGNRLELFVDGHLIDQLNGDARQKVHQPAAEEVSLVTDKPWEGNTSAYYTIFRDGDVYRMYYRGSHADENTQKSLHREVTCYAESNDGVHWTKPNLGLFEWEGSTDNNIVLDGIGTHCFVAFRDDNPACPPASRYKGISRGRPVGKKGLYVFHSPDAIHWSLMADGPVITEGAFDSQNLAFWDPLHEEYVCYYRSFLDGVRAIMTSTSKDFLSWSPPRKLTYPGAPNQHLYTNAIRPYFRAPHIRIGFPTRYLPGTSQVEPVFMSSRDGVTFHRFDEAVIPRTAPRDRDGNRSNYMAYGLVSLPDDERQLAVFGTEAYYRGPDSRLRRFTYRVDGFVSIRGDNEGELLTKPFTFAGRDLVLNYRADSAGQISVEVQREDGTPIPGLDLGSCRTLAGDELAKSVDWESQAKLKELSGEPVRLRIVLKNADLYSIRFRD